MQRLCTRQQPFLRALEFVLYSWYATDLFWCNLKASDVNRIRLVAVQGCSFISYVVVMGDGSF